MPLGAFCDLLQKNDKNAIRCCRFFRSNRLNSQDMRQKKWLFFKKLKIILECNYGERGDELWRTRGRTMENAGTNYGERGDIQDR